MWKHVALMIFVVTVACNSLSKQPLSNQSPSHPKVNDASASTYGQIIGFDNRENNFRLSMCNFSLEIPANWSFHATDPTNQTNSEKLCVSYTLSSADNALKLIISPDTSIKTGFQTCPPDTIIIQYPYDLFYIVRIPDILNNGFVYGDATLLAQSKNDRNPLYVCQSPPALFVGGTFITAKLTKQNKRYDQSDLDTVDQIIESISVLPYQYPAPLETAIP